VIIINCFRIFFINIIYDIISMKGLENIKKVKSPVKSTKSKPNKRNNKSYENFLRGKDEKKNEVSKDRKVIKVQRKRSSPKRVVPRVSKDIRDINDIERKMIQMKDNSIKVPTQNTTMNKNTTPKPVIQNPPKRVEKVVKPKVEPKYNGPQMNTKPNHAKPNKSRRVRISDIDVREKIPDETLTEHKKIVEKKKPEVKKPEVKKPEVKKPEVKKPEVNKPIDKPKRSLTRSINRSINRSNTRPTKRPINRSINRSKNNRSKTNRKISIKNKKLGEKDIKNVSQKMRQIRSTKTDDIKKELEKQGVKVSGKSDRLLKDIYLYSKVCNINIQHEV